MYKPLQQIIDQMPPPAQAPDGARYAGFKERAMALGIDLAILFVAGAIIGALTSSQNPHIAYQLNMIGNTITIAMTLAYFMLFTSSAWQATPGKRAIKLVVTSRGGHRLSPKQAALRVAGMVVSLIVLGMGYVMAAFTADKTALHDLIADTRVVHGKF